MNRPVRQFSLILFCVTLITLVYWFLYGHPSIIGIDDANIYFVYVKNLIQGNGFVYNPGSERVEGFTSFLWVVLISPLFFTGQYFEPSVLCINLLIVSIALWRGIIFLNRITDQHRFLSIPAFIFMTSLAVTPGYFDWTVLSLMETGLWSMLLVMITIVLCDPTYNKKSVLSLSIGLAMLVLTRPESLLWGVVFVSLFIIGCLSQKSAWFSTIKFAIQPIGFFILTLLFLTVFRIYYFGYPLPNTYYAKVSTNLIYNVTEGIRYFLFSVVQSPVLILITLGVSLSFILIARDIIRSKSLVLDTTSRIQFILSSVSLISIAIPIYVGGDHFKLLRFFQPFFPIYLFAILNLSFWRKYLSVQWVLPIHPWLKWCLVLSLIPFLYLVTDTPLHTFLKSESPIEGEFKLAEIGRQEGDGMNELFSSLNELPVVGVSAAGGFAYTYKGKTLDLMGLNNVTMAHALKEKVGMKNHAAFDKETFFKQKPDIFHGYKKISKFVDSDSDTTLLENDPEFLEMHVYRLYKKIFADPRFKSTYLPVIISDKEKKRYLKTYCQIGFIDKLKSHHYNIIIL